MEGKKEFKTIQVNKVGARFKTYQVSSWADGLML